jgi:hypothetical protein
VASGRFQPGEEFGIRLLKMGCEINRSLYAVFKLKKQVIIAERSCGNNILQLIDSRGAID